MHASLENSKRIHWKKHQWQYLAREVARELRRQYEGAALLDFEAGRPDDLDRLVLDLARDVVDRKFDHDGHSDLKPGARKLTGPKQVRHVREMAMEMIRSACGLSQAYPADYLAVRSPAPAPPPAPPVDAASQVGSSPPAAAEEEYVIPLDHILVKREDWLAHLEDMEYVKHRIRLQGRLLRQIREESFINNEQARLVFDLVLDALPHLAPPEERPPAARVAAGATPLFVVAGLRGRDRQHVLDKTAELDVEVVFEEVTRNSDPAHVGDCDHLVATGFCGKGWLARARKLYADRISVVNGLSGVVREIRRLRGGGVVQ